MSNNEKNALLLEEKKGVYRFFFELLAAGFSAGSFSNEINPPDGIEFRRALDV